MVPRSRAGDRAERARPSRPLEAPRVPNRGNGFKITLVLSVQDMEWDDPPITVLNFLSCPKIDSRNSVTRIIVRNSMTRIIVHVVHLLTAACLSTHRKSINAP